MTDITVYDTEHITIKYLPDKKIIYHTVHKPIPSGQPLREALMCGFDMLQHYGASKWVSDDRLNGPMSVEDREWGHTNLNSRAMEAGWKYWALVVPEQLVAAGTMMPTITELFKLGLRMMVFSKVEEAFKWIEQFED
jgi:hypothetical protein